MDGASLVLTYAEDLDESSVPATSEYAVSVAGGTSAPPSTVAVSGKTVTLASAVMSGQTVTVSYTVPGTNLLRDDSAARIPAPALADQSVTNNTGVSTDADTSTTDAFEVNLGVAEGGWRDLVPRHVPDPWRDG